MRQLLMTAGLVGCLAAPAGAMTTGFAFAPEGPVVGAGQASQMETLLSPVSVQASNESVDDWEVGFLEWLALMLFGIGRDGITTGSGDNGSRYATFQPDAVTTAADTELGTGETDRYGIIVATDPDTGAQISATLSLTACTSAHQAAVCGFTLMALAGSNDAVLSFVSGGYDASNLQIFPAGTPVRLSGGEADVAEIAPVPLPASGLLFLAALGGLGALRRRR